MEFVLTVVIGVLLVFGLYTVALVIPNQLNEITEQLKSINNSLKEIKKQD